MQNLSIVIFLMCTLLISSIETTTAQGVKYDWMEDQPPTNKITRIQNNKFTTINTFPRRSIGSIKNGSLTAEQMACFDIICSKPYSIDKIMKAKEINPKLSYLRIYSPQAWQGANDEPDKQASGYPFNTSGSATANNQIFAGHFAYKAYTKTKSDLSNTENQILTVVDAERIAKGTFYYVIRPADSWDNAEHIKVTKSPEGLITVSERGYKSVAKSWPAGSIIAQHQIGNGIGNLNWCYNLSSKSPKDSNGKTGHQAFSDWLVDNFDKDEDGKPSKVLVDGIQYDADPLAFIDGGGMKTRNADLDNDGIPDWGYDDKGNNHWGTGLELFYSNVRDGIDKRGLTNVIILGGVAESYGVLPNNGTQMEGAWSHQFGNDGETAQNFNFKGFYFSSMKAQTGHGVIGPRVTDVQGKEASAIYPGKSGETRNAPVRFSYAMTMMFDGAWFSNQNGFDDAFHYFDEDAVYMQKGENYGNSVLKTNTADILANNKWLGKALGQYQRIYDKTEFALDKNLLPNGNFEAPIGISWSGEKATVKQVTDKKYEGKNALLIEPIIPNDQFHLEGASASGPSIALKANQEYTVCFSVYNEAPERIIKVKMGSYSQKLFVTPGWSKHVINWTEKTGGNQAFTFEVGGDLTKVWIDQLYLFAASGDVLRRDFENGIILANATSNPKTIALNGKFQYIKGNLDTMVNSGKTNITEITVPAYDGVFLVRQKK